VDGNPATFDSITRPRSTDHFLFLTIQRIIGSDEKVAGYRGGLALKEKLLELADQHGNI
jgi:hypothetical protein